MIPLWYALVPFFLFAVFAFLFLIFNLGHLIKFGLQSKKTTVLIGVYILAFTGAMILCLIILLPHDWSAQVNTNNLISPVTTTKLPV